MYQNILIPRHSSFAALLTVLWLMLPIVAAKANTVAPPGKFSGPGLNLGLTFEMYKSKSDCGNMFRKTIECGKYRHRLSEGQFFIDLRNAGIAIVRIPVKWEYKSNSTEPDCQSSQSTRETILPEQLNEVKQAVTLALDANLVVILDVHHEHELMKYEGKEAERREAAYIDLWRAIAFEFKDKSTNLYFELLNEPKRNWSSDQLKKSSTDQLANQPTIEKRWNNLLTCAMSVIRAAGGRNAKRPIVVGALNDQDWKNLAKLPLRYRAGGPVILTFHSYDPFDAAGMEQNCNEKTDRRHDSCPAKRLNTKSRECDAGMPAAMLKGRPRVGPHCWRLNIEYRFGEARKAADERGLGLILGEYGYEDQRRELCRLKNSITPGVLHDVFGAAFDNLATLLKDADDNKVRAIYNNMIAVLVRERLEWIRFVSRSAYAHGMAWVYWNAFGSYGFIDEKGDQWKRSPVLSVIKEIQSDVDFQLVEADLRCKEK